MEQRYDRYSAYKNLAWVAQNILLAFCRAHIRRDDFQGAEHTPSEFEANT